MIATTPTCCRVRIVNHISDSVTVVESPRDRSMVVFDLMKMVKAVNRRRDETVRASLHLLPDMIVLHWHCPSIYADALAADLLEISKPIHEVERVIWGGGQQA
jgi:hypothetical protein